jgi:hypothetical protein
LQSTKTFKRWLLFCAEDRKVIAKQKMMQKQNIFFMQAGFDVGLSIQNNLSNVNRMKNCDAVVKEIHNRRIIRTIL